MNTKLLFLCLMLALVSNPLKAGEKTFVLKDGSRVKGEIISFNNGVYELKSSVFGSLRLADEKVVSILTRDSVASVSPSAVRNSAVPASGAVISGAMSGSGQALAGIQSTIANNPGLMSSIMRLQNDPQMKEVLADPEIMRAVQNFDFEALGRHPKFQALLNNPAIKQIQTEMGN